MEVKNYQNFTYIKYDCLTQYDNNQNLLELMRNISTGVIESKDVKQQLSLIEELRRMRKFQRDLFTVTFSNIRCHFQENMLQSNDQIIMYNSLILVSEIFSYYDFNDINEWISDLLIIVIEISVNSDNQLIQKQSLIALYILANNMFYDETLHTLFKLLKDSDEKISSNACETLLTFIYFIDSTTLINTFDWQQPINIIIELSKSQYLSYLDRLKSVLSYLYHKMDEYTFKNFLLNFSTEEDFNNLIKLIELGTNFGDALRGRINDENLINFTEQNNI